jgi:hypothetical protein
MPWTIAISSVGAMKGYLLGILRIFAEYIIIYIKRCSLLWLANMKYEKLTDKISIKITSIYFNFRECGVLCMCANYDRLQFKPYILVFVDKCHLVDLVLNVLHLDNLPSDISDFMNYRHVIVRSSTVVEK